MGWIGFERALEVQGEPRRRLVELKGLLDGAAEEERGHGIEWGYEFVVDLLGER